MCFLVGRSDSCPSAAELSVAKLRETLRERKEAVIGRWLEDTVAVYAETTGKFLLRKKNQFANPVGQSLRTGTAAIVEILAAGGEAEEARDPLREILHIRAVQDLSPSQAVSFLFGLKRVLRTELGKIAKEPKHRTELAELDDAVDALALLAFDIYVQSREKVLEIRINEVKRGVSMLQRRFGELGFEAATELLEKEKSQRGDNR